MRSLARVVNEHVRDPVDHRISPAAYLANQRVAIEAKFGFIDRTDENGQQIGANG